MLKFLKSPSKCFWTVVLSVYSYFLITGWEATLLLTLAVSIWVLILFGYLFLASLLGYLIQSLLDGKWGNIVKFYKELLR